MTVSEAKRITGGLSGPSKMPGHAYSIPASACVTGSKLVEVPGSRCHQCYALRGHYLMPNVKTAMERRLESLRDPAWVEAMVTLIKYVSKEHRGCDRRRCDGSGCRYFRWHDSGDLQGVWHLEKIVEVARRTPKVKHWLPTGEPTFVNRWHTEVVGLVPPNLTIRLSQTMVDQFPASWLRRGRLISSVHKRKRTGFEAIGAFICPAHDQANKCGECRACWDRRVRHVSYRKH